MKRYGFGIDVGGTAIKMGLFTTDGELIEKWEIKTNKEDQGSRIFDDIAEQIDEKLSERNISKSEGRRNGCQMRKCRLGDPECGTGVSDAHRTDRKGRK